MNHLSFSDCVLNQTDYFGGDLWRERANNLEECQKRCIEVSQCSRWTFLNMDVTGRCYMKNTSNDLMTTTLPALTGLRNSGINECGSNGKIKHWKVITYLHNFKSDI